MRPQVERGLAAELKARVDALRASEEVRKPEPPARVAAVRANNLPQRLLGLRVRRLVTQRRRAGEQTDKLQAQLRLRPW
jgi:hypothetical protein